MLPDADKSVTIFQSGKNEARIHAVFGVKDLLVWQRLPPVI
jgi:hypothetical protein